MSEEPSPRNSQRGSIIADCSNRQQISRFPDHHQRFAKSRVAKIGTKFEKLESEENEVEDSSMKKLWTKNLYKTGLPNLLSFVFFLSDKILPFYLHFSSFSLKTSRSNQICRSNAFVTKIRLPVGKN